MMCWRFLSHEALYDGSYCMQVLSLGTSVMIALVLYDGSGGAMCQATGRAIDAIGVNDTHAGAGARASRRSFDSMHDARDGCLRSGRGLILPKKINDTINDNHKKIPP